MMQERMVQVSAIPPARAAPPQLLLLPLRTTSAGKPGSFPVGFCAEMPLCALTMERVMLVPDKWLPLEPRIAFPSLVDFSHDL